MKDNDEGKNSMDDTENISNSKVKIGLRKWQQNGRVIIEFKKEHVWIEDAVQALSARTATSAAEYQLVIETLAAILIAPKGIPIVGAMLNLGGASDEARICYCTTNDVMIVVRTINAEAMDVIRHCCNDTIKGYFKGEHPITCHSQQGFGKINELTHLVVYIFVFLWFNEVASLSFCLFCVLVFYDNRFSTPTCGH